jgi:hypothetical protein
LVDLEKIDPAALVKAAGVASGDPRAPALEAALADVAASGASRSAQFPPVIFTAERDTFPLRRSGSGDEAGWLVEDFAI